MSISKRISVLGEVSSILSNLDDAVREVESQDKSAAKILAGIRNAIYMGWESGRRLEDGTGWAPGNRVPDKIPGKGIPGLPGNGIPGMCPYCNKSLKS